MEQNEMLIHFQHFMNLIIGYGVTNYMDNVFYLDFISCIFVDIFDVYLL